jgi:hypothetical protein
MELVNIGSRRRELNASLQALESGNILLFPETPFPISKEDRDALLGAGQADGNFHKNIAYRPASGKITGLGKTNPGESGRVQRALANYSRHAIQLLEEVLTPYKSSWRTDYASFRSIEEHGRALPLKKRNDLLHTDAFPTRPTNGDLILRIFSNINPSNTRDWMTSDPFAALAPKYADDAGLARISSARSTWRTFTRPALRIARAAGLPLIDRSPYDEFMLDFHDYLKMNDAYQRDCPKYHFNFPPGATWIVFTDVVPHAVLAGRYALEQTMIISRDTLGDRGRAPASILEQLSGRKLTYPL